MRRIVCSVLISLLLPASAFAQGVEIAVGPQPAPPYAPIEPVPVMPAPVPSEPLETVEQPEVFGFAGLGGNLERIDLRGLDPTLNSPEIAALTGLRLSPEWQGNRALRGVWMGGVTAAFGQRAVRYVRGPELRLSFGGGDVEGPWVRAPGESGLELAVQRAWSFRAELALGVQVPIGPVTPYVLARGSLGAAWLDIGVRDPNGLGELGSETVDAAMFEVGLEAGLEIQLGDGFRLGAAFRASTGNVESLGGMLTLGYSDEPR